MLSVFPTLFSYVMFVPLVFRLIVGLTFLWFGFSKLTRDRKSKVEMFESLNMRPGALYLWVIAVLEIVAGVGLVIGFLTQIATSVLSILIVGAIVIKNKQPGAIASSFGFLSLLLAISLSLLFLGPGVFSFDLPL